ncbi:hypothetical protein [uncultured Brevundimonas sp.]|uniref:hypothetical protein n=1 Tax=uncultured Brevundimonas sp. TaxID=213418 RepID=UPI00262A54C4|nr:hypothetical protein [uncultured Brevundimonas sp.]
MSQHNIIGSEAFDNKRYIIVRNVRAGVGRNRRRRNTILLISVAVVALLVGALLAVTALVPMLMAQPAAEPAAVSSAENAQLRVQPVQPAPDTTAAPAAVSSSPAA